MSLVLAILAGAGAAAATGAILVRGWLRRRRASRSSASNANPAPAPRRAGSAPAGASLLDGPQPRGARSSSELAIGDVVQLEEETRWLASGLRVREAGTLRCSLWYAGPDGSEGVVVTFPPPERHIYWLLPEQAALPAEPPSRLELGASLLDRRQSFPAELEPLGCEPPSLGAHVVMALYQGPAGEAAAVLCGRQDSLVFAGRRIEAGGYDRLGSADPADS